MEGDGSWRRRLHIHQYRQDGIVPPQRQKQQIVARTTAGSRPAYHSIGSKTRAIPVRPRRSTPPFSLTKNTAMAALEPTIQTKSSNGVRVDTAVHIKDKYMSHAR